MTDWARPVGIGFFVLAVLAAIEIFTGPHSVLATAVFVVLGVIAALIGAALLAVAARAGRRHRPYGD